MLDRLEAFASIANFLVVVASLVAIVVLAMGTEGEGKS